MLLSVISGKSDPGMVEQIALGLANLSFSRTHESEADALSVTYLCSSSYNAAGSAGFFRKMENSSDGGRVPQFLSTHPDPGNRVQAIDDKAKAMGCRGTATNRGEYARIKGLLK
jgi:predicted Zn-dependent protease